MLSKVSTSKLTRTVPPLHISYAFREICVPSSALFVVYGISIASMERPDLHQCLNQYSTGIVCDLIQTAGQGQIVMQGMTATILLGWQRDEREVHLMNGISLLHDMHAFATVHILLQDPHLAGPAPLQHHRAHNLSTVESTSGQSAGIVCRCIGVLLQVGSGQRQQELRVGR